MIVEQAVFTSARTRHGNGYHLVAASAGLREPDLRELSLTGPSHDSLWEHSVEAMSVNFFALPSGALCVSQTTPEGEEYSGRGGPRVYTHALIVQPEELRGRFSNNPLALLRAALAQGAAQVYSQPPETLEPLTLFGHASVVDVGLLASWAAEPDRQKLAAAIDAVIGSSRIGLAAGADSLRLVASMVSALPVDCRDQLTFSTGLRYSPSRPFKVCCLEANAAESRRLQRTHGLSVFDPACLPPPAEAGNLASWGRYVVAAMERGEIEQLAEVLSVSRPGLRLDQLPELAHCLATGQTESWLAIPTGSGETVVDERQGRSSVNRPHGSKGHASLAPRPDNFRAAQGTYREDGEHRARPAGLMAAAVMPHGAATMDDPSVSLARRFPDTAENLLRLEGMIFETLAGRPAAAADMPELWRELLHAVGRQHAVEVREVYLRYAIALWRELNDSDPQSSHGRGLGALEILGALAEGNV